MVLQTYLLEVMMKGKFTIYSSEFCFYSKKYFSIKNSKLQHYWIITVKMTWLTAPHPANPVQLRHLLLHLQVTLSVGSGPAEGKAGDSSTVS
jgi:hypothetical protein